MAATADTFRPSASGLFVPDRLSRVREVWTAEEWKLVNRALKLLKTRSMTLALSCGHLACAAKGLQVLHNEQGEVTVRCGHKDRVVRRG